MTRHRTQLVLLVTGLTLLVVLVLCVWHYSFPSLNSADADTIARSVYGVGPVRAAALVAERERGGEYRDWQDVGERMAGLDVGPVLIENMRRTMRLGGVR